MKNIKSWAVSDVNNENTIKVTHYRGGLLVAEAESNSDRDIKAELQELLDSQETVTTNDVRNYLSCVIEVKATDAEKFFTEIIEFLEDRKNTHEVRRN
jgi:hypothetical protein